MFFRDDGMTKGLISRCGRGVDGIVETLRGITLRDRKRILSLRHNGKGQDSQADYRMHPRHGNLL